MTCFWGHTWSQWERYVWVGKIGATIFRRGNEQTIPMQDATEDRQKRHCTKCGYNQDRLVSSI